MKKGAVSRHSPTLKEVYFADSTSDSTAAFSASGSIFFFVFAEAAFAEEGASHISFLAFADPAFFAEID